MDTHRFLFLCGLHKSGTSLLAQVLSQHPQISTFANTGAPEDEGQHLQSVLPAAKEFGGPGRFGFHPGARLNEQSALSAPHFGSRVFAEWAPYWDLERPVLLEKSPPNLLRTRLLQSWFPKSTFVVILRHPVAVSYATQRRSRTLIPSLLEHWLTCHERFREDARRLRDVVTVRYEDLVTSPQGTVDALCQELGLPPVRITCRIDPDVNSRYFRRWRGSPLVYLTRRRLMERFEPRICHFSYSLTACDG
jgi:hypothetical protein